MQGSHLAAGTVALFHRPWYPVQLLRQTTSPDTVWTRVFRRHTKSHTLGWTSQPREPRLQLLFQCRHLVTPAWRCWTPVSEGV